VAEAGLTRRSATGSWCSSALARDHRVRSRPVWPRGSL